MGKFLESFKHLFGGGSIGKVIDTAGTHVTRIGQTNLGGHSAFWEVVAAYASGSGNGAAAVLGMFGSSIIVSILGYVTVMLVVAFHPMEAASLALLSSALDAMKIWLDIAFSSLFGATVFGGIHSLQTGSKQSKTTKALNKQIKQK